MGTACQPLPIVQRAIWANGDVREERQMPKLTSAEVDAFLNERGHLARIATVRPDGAPHVVPVWFICEDGRVLITPRARSAFLANLAREPRIAVTIDEAALPYRKVLIEGRAEIVHHPGEDDIWRDLYRRIARRYVDDAGAEHYVQETIDQPRALIALDLARARVTTWRMPVEGEPFTGIWAKRYYVEGSKMRAAAEAEKGR
jgi:PPOX class probable F420-dependent enzyme